MTKSANYREAMRRCDLMRRARTDLGHHWQQKQLVEALKALLAEKRR